MICSDLTTGNTRRRGTTVLELVVALVVTAAVATAGAAAFRQTIDRRTQLLTSSTETERSAALRALLREWLSAGSLAWPLQSDGLAFTTTADTPACEPGTSLRLFVDDDAATPQSGLTLACLGAASETLERREIDASINAMHVEYFDRDRARWVTADDAPARRPVAVRITFPEIDGSDVTPDHRLWRLPLTVVLSDADMPVATSYSGESGR